MKLAEHYSNLPESNLSENNSRENNFLGFPNREIKMSIRINDTIPDVAVDTDKGMFSLHEWIGNSWAILFSHPKDFTPVCTTEFSAVAKLEHE